MCACILRCPVEPDPQFSNAIVTSLGLENLPATIGTGPAWKEQRRLYHAHLSKEALRKWARPDIEEQAHVFVLRSLEASTTSATDYDM